MTPPLVGCGGTRAARGACAKPFAPRAAHLAASPFDGSLGRWHSRRARRIWLHRMRHACRTAKRLRWQRRSALRLCRWRSFCGGLDSGDAPTEFTSVERVIDRQKPPAQAPSLPPRRWPPRRWPPRRWPPRRWPPRRGGRQGGAMGNARQRVPAFNHRPTVVKAGWRRGRATTTNAPHEAGAFAVTTSEGGQTAALRHARRRRRESRRAFFSRSERATVANAPHAAHLFRVEWVGGRGT